MCEKKQKHPQRTFRPLRIPRTTGVMMFPPTGRGDSAAVSSLVRRSGGSVHGSLRKCLLRCRCYNRFAAIAGRLWQDGLNFCRLDCAAATINTGSDSALPTASWIPPRYARALRDIDYQKAVVMEPFLLKGGEVGQSIRVWRDLSGNASPEQMDQYITDSLVYLKKCCLG